MSHYGFHPTTDTGWVPPAQFRGVAVDTALISGAAALGFPMGETRWLRSETGAVITDGRIVARTSDAPDLDAAHRALSQATRLAELGIAVAPLTERGFLSPVTGSVITVYPYVASVRASNWGDVAVLLGHLHSLYYGRVFGQREPDRFSHVSEMTRARVQAYVRTCDPTVGNVLSTAVAAMDYYDGEHSSSPVVLHSNPNPDNVVATAAGPRFIHTDQMMVGPAGYDLAPAAAATRPLDPSMPRCDAERFARIYGRYPVVPSAIWVSRSLARAAHFAGLVAAGTADTVTVQGLYDEVPRLIGFLANL